MSAAIEVKSLSYTYADGTAALTEVSFRLEPGECVALIGPSGAGKSTLAKCLVGFVSPSSGQAIVDGIEVGPKTLKEVRRRVGLIFQNPDDQLFMPTLFDDVAFGLLQNGIGGNELEERVRRALDEYGLAGLAKKFPGHLSGGQKRLAALAGVLVMEPEALVLDEPSSNLDPQARRNLIGQLERLSNTRLIAGHDLEMALDICSRALLLSGSRLVAQGPPAEILGDRELMRAHGLEVPHSLLPHRHDHAANGHRHR
jgi:cobalt/nickel transport system ATP-binding protein